jgi:translation elongation factor EF-G
LTQGKGEFAMEFLRYLPARAEVTGKLMQEANAEKASASKKKKK